MCLLYLPLILLLAACASFNTHSSNLLVPRASAHTLKPASSVHRHRAAEDVCPEPLQEMSACQTPHSMRVAYGMEALTEQGFTGKGQTVVDVVSYGSPTLQQDMDVFDQQFDLPRIKLTVLAPLGTVPFNAANSDMNSWASETTLDVEIIHAMAPDAQIVVLTSPVDETEGLVGLPEFLQLEQYAVKHHLGQIFSQSYVASETTLDTPQGRQLVSSYTDFYQQITTQEGWTVLNGSGDHGATDYSDIAASRFSPVPIVNFPADVPWVTAVGGTTLTMDGDQFGENAWNGSGGGWSKFFSIPDYQQTLSPAMKKTLRGQRGLPDIAANADPLSAMAVYIDGQWQQVGGTSAATPTWAGIIAVANQMAGHPLGFINPALYAIATSHTPPDAFRDITSGDNSFAQDNLSVEGYNAGVGWDPVTGWGSPNSARLLPALIAAINAK